MFRRALVLASLLALSPSISQAAIYMMVEGVIGPSKTTGYSGWFITESLQWSIDRSKVAEPHSLQVSLQSSAAVATLMQLSAAGTQLKKIVFDQVMYAGAEGAQLLMSRLNCEGPVIRSSAISGDADDQPMAELNIRCDRLAWENYDYSPTAKTVTLQGKGSWNFKTNTP